MDQDIYAVLFNLLQQVETATTMEELEAIEVQVDAITISNTSSEE
jgi:hypothetical protein